MLAQALFDSTASERRPAVITPSRTTAWGEMRHAACSILEKHAEVRRRRVGLSFQSLEQGCAALASLERLECDLFLLDRQLKEGTRLGLAEKLRLGAVLEEAGSGASSVFCQHDLIGESMWSGQATVTILTSGTTGQPKAATHTWQNLGRPVRKAAEHATPRWLLCYRPHLYAGLQVILQCLANQGTLVVPGTGCDPESVAELMASARVEFVSATPSYWRRLLLFAPPDILRHAPIVQVTLGGEVVDQPLLDNLRITFPKARLVHIYATTEQIGRASCRERVSY